MKLGVTGWGRWMGRGHYFIIISVVSHVGVGALEREGRGG